MIQYEPFKTLPISDFYDELRFEYPDIPEQLFNYYLVQTAITMAKRGNLIRRRAVISTHHGVTRHAIPDTDELVLSDILSIRVAPGDCGPSRNIVRAFTPPEGATACCGKDVAWFDTQDNVLHVAPAYCHSNIYLTMAVSPQQGACTLPAVYKTEYLSTLLAGTRSAILRITGRPWTSLQLSQIYENDFFDRLKQDSIRVARNKMKGAIKMNFGRAL